MIAFHLGKQALFLRLGVITDNVIPSGQLYLAIVGLKIKPLLFVRRIAIVRIPGEESRLTSKEIWIRCEEGRNRGGSSFVVNLGDEFIVSIICRVLYLSLITTCLLLICGIFPDLSRTDVI